VSNLKHKKFFVVPGVQKGGTTFLYEMLKQHPEICLPSVKELAHFGCSSSAVLYERNYAALMSESCYGDVSPQYLPDYDALQNIYRYRNDAQLIVLIRHPIDRMLSHLKMELKRGTISSLDSILNLSETELRSTDYFLNSNISAHLHYLFSIFPSEQVVLFRSEALSADPISTLRRVYEFLGLTKLDFVPTGVDKKIHRAGAYRIKFVPRLLNYLQPRLRAKKELVYKLIPQKIFHRMIFKIETEWNVGREKLSDYQLTEIQRAKLEQLLGEDIEVWNGIPDL
jgi:hypothetical protein